jgi:hypothetical protein
MAERKPLIEKYRLAEERSAAQPAGHQPQPQGSKEAPLTRFIPPKYEFRDSTVVVKTAEGRELTLGIGELVRMKPRELAERLGLKLGSFKELKDWKTEVLQTYFLGQPLRSEVPIGYLKPLYVHTEPLFVKEPDGTMVLEREEILWTLWEAGRKPESRRFLILDSDGYVREKRTAYCLALADPQEVAEAVRAAPEDVLKRLKRIAGAGGGGKGGEGGGEEDERLAVAEALVRRQLVLKPVPSLRNAEFLRDIDWRAFVEEELLTYGAPVDPRVLAARRALALKGVDGRYSPHALIVVPSGVGKSVFPKVFGLLCDRATPKTLIGYATSEKVERGLIDGAEEVIGFDQIESSEVGNLARYMLDYMEDGRCTFAVGGAVVVEEGTAPLLFLANPLGTGGEKDFQHVLDMVNENPALGGRIAIIVYIPNEEAERKEVSVIRGTPYELSPEEEEKWRGLVRLLRAVEDYCRKELRAIYRHPKVVEWLKRPIAVEGEDGRSRSYLEAVKEIAGSLAAGNPKLYEFLLNHASQAGRKIRGAALQAALLYNLKDIALNEHSIEKILEEAEERLREIVSVNLGSIASIVRDYEGKREKTASSIFHALPENFKLVVQALEAYRRVVHGLYAGRGQVPAELATVVLEDWKIPVGDLGLSRSYRYLSQALDRLKAAKGSELRFNQIDANFGFRLAIVEEAGRKVVKAVIRRWEPDAAIAVPEKLLEWFREFRKFTDFTSSQASEGGGSPQGVSNSGTVEEASRNKDASKANPTVPASSGGGGGGAPFKNLRTGEVGELVKGTFPDSSESVGVEVETSSQEAFSGSEGESLMIEGKRSVHEQVKTEKEEGCPLFEDGYCKAIGSKAWFRQAVVEKGLRPPCLGGSDRCPVGAYRLEALRRRLEEMVEEAARVWGG